VVEEFPCAVKNRPECTGGACCCYGILLLERKGFDIQRHPEEVCLVPPNSRILPSSSSFWIRPDACPTGDCLWERFYNDEAEIMLIKFS